MGDAGNSGKKCGGGGVLWAEAVLGRGGGERGREKGKNTAFEDFRGGTEKGDGAVGSREGGGFVRFRDRG